MEDISEPGQQVSSTNRGSQQPRRIAFLLLLGLTLLLTFGAVFAAEAFETVSPTIAPLGAHVISAVLVCALVGTITYIFWRMTARTEKHLRQTEARYQALIEQIPAVTYTTSLGPEPDLWFVSPQVETILGFAPPEWLVARDRWIENLHPDDRERVIAEATRAHAMGAPVSLEYRLLARDGREIWFSDNAVVVHDEAGNPLHYQGIMLDITARKKAEQALHESERRFRSLIENGADGVMVIDSTQTIRYQSPSISRILGYSAEETLGRNALDFVHPDDHPRCRRYLAYTLQQQHSTPAQGEIQMRHKDGTWRCIEATISTLSTDPDFSGVVLNYRDVTGRKQAEEALRESEERFRLLVENVSDYAIFMLDPNGRVASWNVGAERMKGYRAQEIIGKPIACFYTPEDIERDWPGQLLRLVTTEGHVEDQGWRVRKDGTRYWADVVITALRNNAGQLRGFAKVTRDITERKRAEEQIQQQMSTLTALYTGTQKLAETLDSHKQAEDVVRTCVEILGARLACVCYAEPDGRVRALAQYPDNLGYAHHNAARWDDTPEGQGPVGQAIRSGTPMILTDLQSAPIPAPWKRLIQKLGLCSLAVFPLISRLRTFGVLMLHSDQPDYFTPERVQSFQSYALQIAVAQENARLFEETERRLSHMQALRKIDVAITSSLDLHMTLDVILEQTVTELNMDAANILLLNPHTHVLSYAAGRGFRTRVFQQVRLHLAEGYAGRAALERRMVMYDQGRVANSGPPNPQYLAMMKAEGFVAHVATPLIAQGQVTGVLEVFHRAALDADDEWLEFMEMLARQAAISIHSMSLFEGLQRSKAELELAYDTTLEGWSHALDLRDKETEGHTLRVAEVAERIAREMGVSGDALIHLHRGALLHDIGKMGIPDSILLKPGPLTDEEWAIMRKHPQYAYEMLYPIKYLRPALDIPYCHHEKWDGTGYPRGLKGEEIPLAARIFAVADVWDALSSNRPYRVAWPEEKLRDHIRAGAGTHFDPQVVEVFLRLQTA